MRLTNAWNRLIYRLWAPVYDATVERAFIHGRRRALALLAPAPGERVLLAGVGTGADLVLLPAGVQAVGVDLSPAMLARARAKLARCAARAGLVLGDAQALPVPEAAFDAAILNLILSVVPDGGACLREALRALKPGGRAIVFDKFQPDDQPLTWRRRGLNVFSTRLGTDITRRFGDLQHGAPCVIEHDEPSLLGGMYRVLLLRKPRPG